MLRDKLLPGTKPGFLKSEKMLRFILLYTHKSVSEKCLCLYFINFDAYCCVIPYIVTHIDTMTLADSYCHVGDINLIEVDDSLIVVIQADVIAFVYSFYWQMLLPKVTKAITSACIKQ